MPSVRILWIFCLVVLCHLGGPALRVMWAANGAVSQAARVPIARLSVPRLRGSTLPHLYDQSVEIGIACQGPGSERDPAGGALGPASSCSQTRTLESTFGLASGPWAPYPPPVPCAREPGSRVFRAGFVSSGIRRELSGPA